MNESASGAQTRWRESGDRSEGRDGVRGLNVSTEWAGGVTGTRRTQQVKALNVFQQRKTLSSVFKSLKLCYGKAFRKHDWHIDTRGEEDGRTRCHELLVWQGVTSAPALLHPCPGTYWAIAGLGPAGGPEPFRGLVYMEDERQNHLAFRITKVWHCLRPCSVPHGKFQAALEEKEAVHSEGGERQC